jgi:hypothetical protein
MWFVLKKYCNFEKKSPHFQAKHTKSSKNSSIWVLFANNIGLET